MPDDYLTEKLQEILVYTAPEQQPWKIAALVDEFIQGKLYKVEDLVDSAREWATTRDLWKTTSPSWAGTDVAMQRELDAVAAERALKEAIEDLDWHR